MTHYPTVGDRVACTERAPKKRGGFDPALRLLSNRERTLCSGDPLQEQLVK